MTYQEMNGSIKNKKIAWIGDGCNVCQTYMQAAGIFDFELSIATPQGYEPSELYIDKLVLYVLPLKYGPDSIEKSKL